MPLDLKVQQAFQALLIAAGAAARGPDFASTDLLQVVAEQENQNTVPRLPYVVISTRNANAISPKAATMQYDCDVIVVSTADSERTDVVAEEVCPELAHSRSVDLVRSVLMDNPTPLAERLTDAGITGFGCIQAQVTGEPDLKPQAHRFQTGLTFRVMAFEYQQG